MSFAFQFVLPLDDLIVYPIKIRYDSELECIYPSFQPDNFSCEFLGRRNLFCMENDKIGNIFKRFCSFVDDQGRADKTVSPYSEFFLYSLCREYRKLDTHYVSGPRPDLQGFFDRNRNNSQAKRLLSHLCDGYSMLCVLIASFNMFIEKMCLFFDLYQI